MRHTSADLPHSIISTVLGWEVRGLKKRVVQLEKTADAPSKDQLESLREYTKMPPDEQERYRFESRETSVPTVDSHQGD